MGHSSLLGVEKAPLEPDGRDEEALGPSDSSDSGSDRVGVDQQASADPAEPVDVTLGRDVEHAPVEPTDPTALREGSDISIDQVFELDAQPLPGVDKAEAIDQAMAPDPDEDEDEDEDDDEDAADADQDKRRGRRPPAVR
jgi:hypothetical protein